MNKSIFHKFAMFIALFSSQSTGYGYDYGESGDDYAVVGPRINFEFEMKLSQQQGDKQAIIFSILNSGNVDLLIDRGAFGTQGVVLYKETKCVLINENGKKSILLTT